MKALFPLAAIAMLVLLGGCSVLDRGPQSSPGKLMETYLEAFQQNDLQSMLQLSERASTGSGELKFQERIGEMIELESYSIDGTEYLSDDEALVKITVKLLLMEREKSHTEQVRVVRKEGRWYLRGGLSGPP